MIEINSVQALKESDLKGDEKLIVERVTELLSVLFETDNFSCHASLFLIDSIDELENYEKSYLFENLSEDSFEFVDLISVEGSESKYYLACIVPSDDYGAYILINANIDNRNLEIFANTFVWG